MKIDGEVIEPEELSAEFRRLMESQQDRPDVLRLPEDEVRGLAVEHVINKHLILREARRRYPEVQPDEVRRRVHELKKRFGQEFDPSQHREAIEDDVRADKLVSEVQASVSKAGEEALRAEYEENRSIYAKPERVHVSHIVRHTFGGADPGVALKQIMEAQRLLKSGSPFETVAQRFSDQHGQAGDLGTFARGAMVEKFENVVFRMKAGETSDVFQTEFGYHIALVHEKHPARERSFEEARADVARALRERERQAELDRFVEALRQAAQIERDD